MLKSSSDQRRNRGSRLIGIQNAKVSMRICEILRTLSNPQRGPTIFKRRYNREHTELQYCQIPRLRQDHKKCRPVKQGFAFVSTLRHAISLAKAKRIDL